MLGKLILASSTIVGGVLGHAILEEPEPRTYGDNSVAACGVGVSKSLNDNPYGPLEVALTHIDDSYNATACDVWFCRGYDLEDNLDKVQKYSVGQNLSMHVDIMAHHTGYANVSIVDLKAKKRIGESLITWPVYANSSLGPSKWPKNESDFNIIIPDLSEECAEVGNCAIQWWWHATENNQTYTCT